VRGRRENERLGETDEDLAEHCEAKAWRRRLCTSIAYPIT